MIDPLRLIKYGLVFRDVIEVIEASVLFGLRAGQVAVTVHPQSQVHAMVGFHDGSYQLQVTGGDRMRVMDIEIE